MVGRDVDVGGLECGTGRGNIEDVEGAEVDAVGEGSCKLQKMSAACRVCGCET